MNKLLVLGKNGTLGSEFMRLHPEQCIGWDREDLDITDPQAVINKITELNPEAIINCAAYNAVDKAEEETDKANLINGTAVGYLAEAANRLDIPLVHYSTNYVFDGAKQDGYLESDPPNPQSAYGKSKLLGEFESAKALKRYTLRTAWLYGQQGASSTSKVNYITRILQLAKEKDFLEGVADQFGQPTWTKDIVATTMLLLNTTATYGLYHCTNSGRASWYTWAKEILRIKKIDMEVRENSMSNFHTSGHTAPRPKYGILQNTKLPPLRFWQEALQEYLTTTSTT